MIKTKSRLVNCKFWDDKYTSNLDPIEKLLFLYFLTNPLTNLIGVYEIELRRIAFDTGIDKEMVNKIIERFSRDKKIYYFDGYIIIKNFVKFQNEGSEKIKIGIKNLFNSLPENIKKFNSGVLKGIDTLSHINTNINTNTNNNTNSNNVLPEKTPADNDFEKFWDLYDKKIGDRKKIHIKFNKLKEEDRNKIFETLPEYVNSTPDKKFRKNPETYLNNCSWNDEIIQIKPSKIKDDLEPEKF